MSGSHSKCDCTTIDVMMFSKTLYSYYCFSYSLSELPECQVPLARRTYFIDQVLAIALHPAYDYENAEMSLYVILNLVQSPEAHTFIVRREVMEKMLEICEQRHKMVNQQTQHGKKENVMVISVLRYVAPLPFSAFLSFVLSFILNRHRRRNRGGTGGTCPPPQPAGKGGSAPTARAMPIHAVLGLIMRYHMKFQEQVAANSVLVDLLLVSTKKLLPPLV